ncbi:hypothetical protein ACQEVF_57505 [Nonomuraea polychroma]|uniref:hypothetical protein n=1 Tax=Nonomuraea polychroma TaxID=46176 RepID=UPI003D900D29
MKDIDIHLSEHIDNIQAAAGKVRAELICQLNGDEPITPETLHWALEATAEDRLWRQVRNRAAVKSLPLADAAALVAAELGDQLRGTPPPLAKATFVGECEQVEWTVQQRFVRMVERMKAKALT